MSKNNAIIPNLPHPVISVTETGGHAYISLIALLANEMADVTQYDQLLFEKYIVDDDTNSLLNNTEVTTISDTASARKLFWELHESHDNIETYTMYLWLKEWRDGFDPNTTKSSRNQVWMNTFTISPPETEVSGKNTYFMSIAGKTENHSEMDQLYNDEILLLSTIGHDFYHGGMRQIIKVKLGKLITCVDRPERASIFKVGDHTGTYSKYWGYAGHIDGSCKFNHLPSCTSCRMKRINMINENQNYELIIDENSVCCSDWNVTHNNFTFPIPKNYPTNYDISNDAPPVPFARNIIIKSQKRSLNSNNSCTIKPRLPMVEMTIDWLKEALVFVHIII